MKMITVYDIEGIPSSKIGYSKELYTFDEMIHYKNYDEAELENDRDIEERDNPSGWVLQERKDKKWIFVPVYEFEEWEEIKHKCSGNCANCTCKH
jgi:hypothetical protein